MKSEVAVPPVRVDARAYSLSEITIPMQVIIFEEEEVNSEISEAFAHLAERIHSLSTKAKAEKNGRRVSELRFFEQNMRLLEKVTKVECKAKSEVMEEAAKGFRSLYDRAKLEMGQFMVDGNVRRVVEMDYILDDLKKLKAKAVKYGIVL